MNLRMPELNRVIMAVRLGRAPELTYIASGTARVEVSAACSRRRKGPDGETKEEATWVNLQLWDKRAEFIAANATKGTPMIVEGRLETHEFEKDGDKKTHTRIVVDSVQLLGWPDDAPGTAPASKPAPKSQPTEQEDLPF